MGNPKWEVYENEKYEKFIESKPCAVCGKKLVDKHHDRHARRNSYLCVPLCRGCHTFGKKSYHAIERNAFEKHHNLNLDWLIIGYLSEFIKLISNNNQSKEKIMKNKCPDCKKEWEHDKEYNDDICDDCLTKIMEQENQGNTKKNQNVALFISESFSAALAIARTGKPIVRRAWGSAGYVFVKKDDHNNESLEIMNSNGDSLRYTPTTTDLFADDWHELVLDNNDEKKGLDDNGVDEEDKT